MVRYPPAHGRWFFLLFVRKPRRARLANRRRQAGRYHECMDPKNLATLIESDQSSDIPTEMANTAWITKVDAGNQGGRPTAFEYAAERGSLRCFKLFAEAMCSPSVWRGIAEEERGRLEVDFLNGVSTFYAKRFLLDGADDVAKPTARDAIELFFRKDGSALILAKRNKASFDEFGAAFDSARQVLELLVTDLDERADLNSAMQGAAPPGVKARRL